MKKLYQAVKEARHSWWARRRTREKLQEMAKKTQEVLPETSEPEPETKIKDFKLDYKAAVRDALNRVQQKLATRDLE